MELVISNTSSKIKWSTFEHRASNPQWLSFEYRASRSNIVHRLSPPFICFSGGEGIVVRISELRLLDIVNIKDGRRLGPIKDLDLDLERGVVKGIVVPGPSRSWGFFGGGKFEDFIIPWERVKKIGVDVILVDASDLPDFEDNEERR